MHCIRQFLAVAILLVLAMPAAALDRYMNQGPDRLVIRGYDTTAYFTSGKPKAGSTANTVEWNGVKWRFATAREAAKFRANPSAYAPQFGAYCTGGLSQQHVVPGNPKIWRLYKGKLYLFFAHAGGRRFDRDPEGTIAKARAYWTTLDIR